MSHNSVMYVIRSRTGLSGQVEVVEQTGEGELGREGDKWVLSWHENAAAGLGETAATLSLYPGGAVLERRGETRARMVFREGKVCPCRYETPFGALPMEGHTRRVDYSLTEDGGKIELSYTLRMDGGPLGENDLSIVLRKKGS